MANIKIKLMQERLERLIRKEQESYEKWQAAVKSGDSKANNYRWHWQCNKLNRKAQEAAKS